MPNSDECVITFPVGGIYGVGRLATKLNELLNRGQIGCPCRKSNPTVLVMQTTKMRLCEDPTDVLNFAWKQRVFVQRQMRAGLVVICQTARSPGLFSCSGG